GEVIRTDAPGKTPPCSSVTVPTRAPVKPCAPTRQGDRKLATSRSTRTDKCTDGQRFWAGIPELPSGRAARKLNESAAESGKRAGAQILTLFCSKIPKNALP